MTRITLIDCRTAGISGDMLLGALIDAGADPRLIQDVLKLIPDHYPKCRSIQIETEESKTHGFRACRVEIKTSENPEEIQAETVLQAAAAIATTSRISEKAASFAVGSINVLVDAESRVHGVGTAKTHLHEAGSADTLADIFGVAVACDNLGIFDGEVYCTPVAVGGGTVTFSHGTWGTPAPAVLEVLRQHGIPILGGPEAVELATPTGVSMLVNLAKNVALTYPPLIPERVGYGAGKKELPGAPNLLRVVLGRTLEHGLGSDTVQILETNLDDLPGEMLGHALQRVLDSGAKDAWLTPAYFKKNRPGHVLHVICDPQDAQRLARVIMEETGTLGVRFQQSNRLTLRRDIKTIEVKIGNRKFEVRVKFAKDESRRIVRMKPEFDDVHAIAEALSLPAREVSDIVMREVQRFSEKKNRET